jgi:hypothetical protein
MRPRLGKSPDRISWGSCDVALRLVPGCFPDVAGPSGYPLIAAMRGNPETDAMCQQRTNALRCYSSTSSAAKMTDCGIVKPSILAVLPLTTMVNCAGSSTGRSVGLVPFKILSMNAAERLKLHGMQTP